MQQWFAIRVSPRWEARSSAELSIRGLDTYVPVSRQRHQWSDRVKTIDVPLFNGYLFSRFSLNDRLRVLQTPGVKQIVGIGKAPAPIEDSDIDSLKALVSSRCAITPWPYLQSGRRVRIDRGLLAGVEGFVVPADSGAARIVVSVNPLQQSVATDVSRDYVLQSCTEGSEIVR